MSPDLLEKRCRPCEGGVAPLGEAEAKRYLGQVQGWSLIEGKKIRKEWRLRDFKESWGFANQVALLAEEEAHHPDIRVVYSWVRIELTTHSIQGLSENDFIMAAKIDRLRPK
ncbi:MAG: 4a-hydroxytetrahydrobiopterin dehydratase [Euryarchaeota archaeon]|nr:4a-hydroxytetrahydrobiopterin dehydratase [Euryarchaeota archaeon]